MTERNDDDLIIDKNRMSPNFGSRGGIIPDMIVLHTSEGYFDSGVDWLCSERSQASTHFFVGKKGQVAKLVNIKNAAWGNATTYKMATDGRYYKKSKNELVSSRPYSANRYTISIECEGIFAKDGGKLTEAQHKAVVKLIKRIIKRVRKVYGTTIPVDRTHIVSHSELAPAWKPNCGTGIDKDRIVKDLLA